MKPLNNFFYSALKLILPSTFIAAVWIHIAPHLNINHLTSPNPLPILFALLLWPLNQFLETWKWKNLTPYFPQKLSTLAKNVTVGQYLGLFTPNRIGDGLGRLFNVPAEFRKNHAFAFVNGAIAQLLTTLLMGASALLFTNADDPYLVALHLPPFSQLKWTIFCSSFILTALYVFPHWFSSFRKKWNPEKFPGKQLASLQVYSSQSNLFILSLSILRYAVFCSQYLLLLYGFDIHIPTSEALIRIALVYLITTVIPTGALAELGVRESAAALILAPSPLYVFPVVSATLLLWMINIGLPALIGLIFTLRESERK